jgi:endothelin-converting enzyme/putative endopeptidase
MDEKRIEELGLEPIRPLLGEIDGATDMAGVERLIGRLHELSVPVPFGLRAASDSHEPTRVIASLYASGLGLPDRDYYVKTEARFREVREKYRSHVMRMLELTGLRRAAARRAAEQVFAMERRLALATLDDAARRDPRATDHRTSFLSLTELAPQFDWGGYFAAAKLPRAALNVEEPEFLKAMDALVLDTPLGAWRAYLKWHLVRSAAPHLSSPFAQESFAFRDRYIGGAAEMKPRSRRCAESADRLLGEALGRKYVEKHFPPAAKARAQELVRNLLLATADTIRGLEWMGPGTKAKALAKLATFRPKIGYPDVWKDYSRVEIRRDAFWAGVVSARSIGVSEDRARIGKPVDRGRWGLTPPTPDAYYDPLLNEIVLPAGMLQPPAFGPDASDAVNYGAIGVVIGHEISHGFDDEGARYDARGRLASWWTAKDLARFRARGQCVVDQFEEYFIEPGVHHDGKLVLGESIGDLAGVKIAYRAFLKSLEGRPAAPTIDGFTPEQQFFVAWGQFRGDAILRETERLMLQRDPHPTGKYRVIGPLSNLSEFQKAFACPADAPMVRPADRRCEVW